MAQVQFPSSPSDGDQYTVNNVTYTWNNTSGLWEANNATALADTFVEVAGDTMTGDLSTPNLTLPSNGKINDFIFLTAADKATAADGDALVYDAATGALVLKSAGARSEIKQTGGSTTDAALINPSDPSLPGDVACTTSQPTGTGWTQLVVASHGAFRAGANSTTYQVGIFTFEVDGSGTETFFASDYVRWTGGNTQEVTFSVQGFYNIDPTKKYITKIGISKEGGSGTASPITNSSVRCVFAK